LAIDLNITTMSGISTAGIQAPTANLDTTTTSATIPVVVAPIPLIAADSRQRG
jgi:hypothetical protein